ncbi:ATP-binding protein [Ilumatobacter coccineus]|uniref:histidine kinase n=1 Tax=Ilumatobacter coccineus (strain NBRC 103263 / KCTC 29153 / YM16-304) TaxID=1313172 RepID=A0A6C7E4X6_ILUCY|nr:ATP-binding protein [Ilumatobacter coccineus]BAN01917.1 putative two-component histidine kinase [Ilumatobacter coccineus YM16-304]
MTSDLERSVRECRIVVGPDAVSTHRANAPDAPIVALVDATSPIQAVLAQAAGADIVLPTPELEVGALAESPGLALAVTAAEAIANRRREVAGSARQVGHDLASTVNVVGLAADVAISGATPPDDALTHIASLARSADADIWRAGRASRSLRRAMTVVDVVAVARGHALAAPDVDIATTVEHAWVFADERELTSTLSELIQNARTASARRVRLSIAVDAGIGPSRVRISVDDDGTGFDPATRDADGRPEFAPHRTSNPSARAGLGLATIAEFAGDIGARVTVSDADDEWSTRVELSIPLLDDPAGKVAARAIAIDQATAQANILERVVRQAPVTESLDAIVAAIENQLPDSACSVLLLRNGRTLHHGSGAKLPSAYRDAIDGVEIGRGQGSCGTAAYTGRPVIATDVTTDSNWVSFRDVALEHDLRSCWSTPIVAAEGGEVLGTFAVYKSSVWSPDQAAIRLVKRFTYLAAVAIEHHRLFGALAESESRFRSAFEGATAGLALVDLDGSLLKVNPSLSRMLGRSESSLLSKNMLDLLDAPSRPLIRAAWDQLIADGPMTTRAQPTIEVPLADPPGDHDVWVSLSTSIVAAPEERSLYVEVRDITASRRHLAEQRAREAAEASNRAKTDFLALVSHELRTPLNAILGFAQVMQLSKLDAEQHTESVDHIVNAGEHLRDLIDQLLDLSRIEAGQLSVSIGRVDTADAIADALDIVGPLAGSRNIALVHDRHNADRHDVLADRRCLRQVLINLLGNAVKFTPPDGRIDVDVATTSAGTVRVTVTDTGPGIAPESIDLLFQPFRRLHPERPGRAEGTGLGLSLSARLMSEMGGTIGVDSTVGVGSSFWIEFPPADDSLAVAVGDRPLALDSPDTDAVTPVSGVVLYVEDDRACLDVMHAALALRPLVELRTASTAADGSAQLRRGNVDLVLLDIGLPDRSGWDLLDDIRVTDTEVPVLVLTAGTDAVPDPAPRHLELLTKPLDIPAALRVIDAALSGTTLGHSDGQTIDSLQQ